MRLNSTITCGNTSMRRKQLEMAKKNKRKIRNWLAVHAHLRGGSGSHGDKKKQDNKSACRGRIEVKLWQLKV